MAKVQKSVEIATYEKTIQTAFREVSDALAARGTYLDQLAAQQKLVNANADSYRLAQLRFRNGVDTFLAALIAEQALFQSQQTLLSLKSAQLQNLVTLYKALGGGWDQDTTTPAEAAAGAAPRPRPHCPRVPGEGSRTFTALPPRRPTRCANGRWPIWASSSACTRLPPAIRSASRSPCRGRRPAKGCAACGMPAPRASSASARPKRGNPISPTAAIR